MGGKLASIWARRGSSSWPGWSRAPPGGLEGLLQHMMIHSLAVMKSLFSSALIRKYGSLKGGEVWKSGMERDERFGMIAWRIPKPLQVVCVCFFITEQN